MGEPVGEPVGVAVFMNATVAHGCNLKGQTKEEQMAKGAELDQLIRQKLGGLGYEF